MAAPFDLSRLAVTGPPVPIVDGVLSHAPSGAAQFAFSRNGVAGLRRAGGPADRTMVWVDRRGGVQPLDGTEQAFPFPRLSPDDQHVVFGSGARTVRPLAASDRARDADPSHFRHQHPADLDSRRHADHVRLLQGGTAEPVPDSGRRQRPPERLLRERVLTFPNSWSPDGQHLGFMEIHPPTRGTSGAAARRTHAAAVPPDAVQRRMDGVLARTAAGSRTPPTNRAAGRSTCSRSRVRAGRCRFPPKAVPK